MVDNDVSKAFHHNVCKEATKVTATGTVKKSDGKNEFTATKIELVKLRTFLRAGFFTSHSTG